MTGENILEALETALRTREGVAEVVAAFFRLAERSDNETRDLMLEALGVPLRAYSGDRIAKVALLAGALVELGADPQKAPPALFDHILEQLKTVEGAEDDTELPPWFYTLEQAAMACLSRSAELRKHLPQREAILTSLHRYDEQYGFIGKMIQVLDDEPLLVLHPSSARGFRFTMSGVADNFQLHLLLLGALAGSGPLRIEGIVPSGDAIDAASAGAVVSDASVQSGWQLANWSGLRVQGEVDSVEHQKSWIWNEGVPADIAPFEGTRVVLISPSTIERGWNAQRVFTGMHGRLDGPVPLPPSEAQTLLERVRRAQSRAGDAV